MPIWLKIIIYGYTSIYITFKIFKYLTKEKLRNTKNENNQKKLITACFGDEQRMNRLMSYELKKDGTIGKEEAAKRAIERLQRDRK